MSFRVRPRKPFKSKNADLLAPARSRSSQATHQVKDHLNAVVQQTEVDESEQGGVHQKQGRPLKNKSIAIKDNIVTRAAWDREGEPQSQALATTAASKILAGYGSPFDATIVKLLKKNGAKIEAKTNLDEFGMGSHSQHSNAGRVLSRFRRKGVPLSPGGSSGGSAVVVATGQQWAAVGTDTGGSVRLPAAYVGVVGFKPSYGLLSRWGVIQYANSLDTVGVLARKVMDARTVFEVLDEHDEQDPTSLAPSVRRRIAAGRDIAPSNRIRIGIPVECNIEELSEEVREAYIATLESLRDRGHSIHLVSLPTTRQALSAYYVLAPAEASSNLAKYDGIRYGGRTEGTDSSPSDDMPLYAETRSEGFQTEVKRRILLGTYTLSSDAMNNYFIKAQKVRRLVQRDFNLVLSRQNPLLDADADATVDGVDVLLTPTAPTLPATVEDVKQQTPVERYMSDVFTVPASLAGLPAASVPVPLSDAAKARLEPTDVESVGVQVVGQFGDDGLVLRVAQMVEDLRYSSV